MSAAVVIVGGGAIGLSLAYELALRDVPAKVIERNQPSASASWAGAGILTPASLSGARRPIDRLRALSRARIAEWSARLRRETGIDNGFWRSGSLRLAFDDAQAEALAEEARDWRQQGVAIKELAPAEVAKTEPLLSPDVRLAYSLAGEAQLRNPRHLQALAAACSRRNVEWHTGTEARGFATKGRHLRAVLTGHGPIEGEAFVITAGAWSSGLLESLGTSLAGSKPIRGQIVLLNAGERLFHRILWNGPRYLVPRADGKILIGSTEEDVGFDARPTATASDDLRRFARRVMPALAAIPVERAWAGLRPGSPDHLPCLGRMPQYRNLYLACGHFRAGLELSAGTARVMAELILGEEPSVPLAAFRPARLLTAC